jgi:hypothetical protein
MYACMYESVTNVGMVRIFEMCGKCDLGRWVLVKVKIINESISGQCVIIDLKFLLVLPYEMWHTY